MVRRIFQNEALGFFPAKKLMNVMLKFMNRAVWALIVVLGQSGLSQAQTSSHTVRVTVSEITNVQVVGGVVNLTVDAAAATAGQDLMAVVDQTTSLAWGTNGGSKKVTVATNLAPPKYTLKLLAVSPTQGSPAPEVSLSNLATDFLLGIARSMGTCQLRYTVEALASLGTGTDAHLITFTIVNQ